MYQLENILVRKILKPGRLLIFKIFLILFIQYIIIITNKQLPVLISYVTFKVIKKISKEENCNVVYIII